MNDSTHFKWNQITGDTSLKFDGYVINKSMHNFEVSTKDREQTMFSISFNKILIYFPNAGKEQKRNQKYVTSKIK